MFPFPYVKYVLHIYLYRCIRIQPLFLLVAILGTIQEQQSNSYERIELIRWVNFLLVDA